MNRKNRQELANLFIRTVKSFNSLEFDYDLSQSSPEFCIHFMRNIINPKLLKKLILKIRQSQSEWIKEFIELKGLLLILNIIDKYSNKQRLSYQTASLYSILILSKCICCVKEILNSKIGMESLIDLMNDNISVMRTFSKGIFFIFNYK
jgi:hypothetical protein